MKAQFRDACFHGNCEQLQEMQCYARHLIKIQFCEIQKVFLVVLIIGLLQNNYSTQFTFKKTRMHLLFFIVGIIAFG